MRPWCSILTILQTVNTRITIIILMVLFNHMFKLIVFELKILNRTNSLLPFEFNLTAIFRYYHVPRIFIFHHLFAEVSREKFRLWDFAVYIVVFLLAMRIKGLYPGPHDTEVGNGTAKASYNLPFPYFTQYHLKNAIKS